MADDDARGSLPIGTLVGGRFKTERLIGRGGMGEVYAARHATTGKEVALKLIHAASGSSKDHVRRFLREARAATAIDHPNVIEVLDVFEDEGGTPVMVMELLKGEPFGSYRERSGALDLHQTAVLLLPVVRALMAAHAKGIVHRDLKPDNIFLADGPGGRVTKLLDFGIAKVLDPTKLNTETQGQNTNTGSILGTPHYMSFEQAMSDKQVDHRTDIWAMGVILFESLTGRRPLAYDSLGQMYANFLQGTVPSIRDFVPELPDDAADVLDRCLAKQREERLADLAPLERVLAKYTSADEAGAHAGGRVVASPVRDTSTTATPVASTTSAESSVRRGRRPWIAGAIVAAGLAVAGLALSRSQLKEEASPGSPRSPPVTTAASVASTTPPEPTAPAPPTPATPGPHPVASPRPSTTVASAPPVTHPTASAPVRPALPRPATPPRKTIAEEAPY